MGTETTDEWTIRSDEEELEILYAEWESDWEIFEDENTTIPICLECGNPLTRWSAVWITPQFHRQVLFCEVCR